MTIFEQMRAVAEVENIEARKRSDKPPCRAALTCPGDYPPLPVHLHPPVGELL